MSKKSEAKITFRVRIILELDDKGTRICQELYMNATAVDKAALRHRLKVYRIELREKMRVRYPGALLQRMDFLLEDGTKILAKGKKSENRKKKDESRRKSRAVDRSIKSGDFSVLDK